MIFDYFAKFSIIHRDYHTIFSSFRANRIRPKHAIPHTGITKNRNAIINCLCRCNAKAIFGSNINVRCTSPIDFAIQNILNSYIPKYNSINQSAIHLPFQETRIRTIVQVIMRNEDEERLNEEREVVETRFVMLLWNKQNFEFQI